MMKRIFFPLCLLWTLCPAVRATSQPLPAAAPSDRILAGEWSARWVAHPDFSPVACGVYLFRNSFDLKTVPETFVIHLSADNRYRFFVNGTPVSRGPARGVLRYWYYETIDIAPYLKPGGNTLAAQVWNLAELRPYAQDSRQTAFLVQGDTPAEKAVDTPGKWVAARDESHTAIPIPPSLKFLGSTDRIDGAKRLWGWERPGFDDGGWRAVQAVVNAKSYGQAGGSIDWVLTPRDIPPMEEVVQRFATVRRVSGPAAPAEGFLRGAAPLTVPAHSRCTILLDQSVLTTAYPELIVGGGKGAEIKLTYAEGLMSRTKDLGRRTDKGNRNDIDGKICVGYEDVILPDGSPRQVYQPLWFRTFRYLEVSVATGDDPLTLHDMYSYFTAYPFEVRGGFSSDDPSLDRIWEVGWRTARLCANETYFDCPYYEQLQYLGDTRIQALISLYVSGDDRLMRKAIRMFDLSRSPEGITTSRSPSYLVQYIPPFSLYWVNMVHDYWMHRQDDAFVREFLPGIRTVLAWFLDRIDPETGMLRADLPYWNFIDYTPGWRRGMPPEGGASGSSILSLQLAAALRDASDLMAHFGARREADAYAEQFRNMTAAAYRNCWDPERGLLKNFRADESGFAQHPNVMGILTDAIPAEQQKAVFERVLTDETLTPVAFYYRFYLTRAMKKTGMGHLYASEAYLRPWNDMIAAGLTTFAEMPEPTRSDCHAWSASPNYDFLATVCGVEPAAPGFASVKVEPQPGRLRQIRGVVPHPQGSVVVDLHHSNGRIRGEVTLPASVPGVFRWQGREIPLQPGPNRIDL